MENTELLKKRLKDNKKNSPAGVYSVCSAHKTVLEASMLQARDDNSLLIIESTSNQVNQYGGYTGMKASDFAAYVKTLAESLNFPFEKILLGGDHLGPQAWQGEKAETAMEKAAVLVKSYVQAGYKKIHLDASAFCIDDTGDRTKPLADEIVADRTALLCRVCEESMDGCSTAEKPLYIVGTEVPVPGGSQEKENSISPTGVENIQNTISVTEKAFKKAGLDKAWERVIAVVAQPGVEFGDSHVFYYDRGKALPLSRALENFPLVYEVHSTDYQTARCLKQLVEDHFCILKVGPWLTYAYREALFSLAKIEKELSHKIEVMSGLEETAERVMLNSLPDYWKKYYSGTEEEKRFARKFSLSDRIRYYWPNRELDEAVERLLKNLSIAGIPLSLVSQYLPHLFMPLCERDLSERDLSERDLCEGAAGKEPRDLVVAHIRSILALYARSCGF